MNEDRRAKVLVVDDEPRVVRLVSEVLKATGHQVLAACDGETALETAAVEQPDLVLLDVLLPRGLDGYAVCRRLRTFSDTPVIMLTAKALESDMLRGFEAGADDYLTKPFSAKELLARVRAVLRRCRQTSAPAPDPKLLCGDLVVDLARRTATIKGQPIILTPTEFALLRELASHPNRVLLHADLLTAVWGQEYRDDVDYLRAYVRYLRRKLEADPANPGFIVTSPGAGYMLVCPEPTPAG
jgi:two-component system KDP operon response regulator KdpE